MCFIKELNFNILLKVLNGFIYMHRPKQSFQTSDVFMETFIMLNIIETFASILNCSLCGLHVFLTPFCTFLISITRYKWVFRLV